MKMCNALHALMHYYCNTITTVMHYYCQCCSCKNAQTNFSLVCLFLYQHKSLVNILSADQMAIRMDIRWKNGYLSLCLQESNTEGVLWIYWSINSQAYAFPASVSTWALYIFHMPVDYLLFLFNPPVQDRNQDNNSE